MKKIQSVSFQLDATDLQNKRLLSLYKRLQRNRVLTRFCREAFIEKADRHLSGLDQSYAQLNHCIKSKGIQYVLDAIREKEAGVSPADESMIQKAADKIILALKEYQKESSRPALRIPKRTNNNKVHVAAPQKTTIPSLDGHKKGSQHKPDLEKLKALLS
ncbi:hypothetical protein [Paenibacillus thermotolerans]|uniref:hypothetical protein n=1 Tax=Paenibacillus thermotolerans TaxID=3027807 RepID=UPI002368477E|nr:MULTISPECIES: hypothetical protein [unclassified Paenibacillus]